MALTVSGHENGKHRILSIVQYKSVVQSECLKLDLHPTSPKKVQKKVEGYLSMREQKGKESFLHIRFFQSHHKSKIASLLCRPPDVKNEKQKISNLSKVGVDCSPKKNLLFRLAWSLYYFLYIARKRIYCLVTVEYSGDKRLSIKVSQSFESKSMEHKHLMIEDDTTRRFYQTVRPHT